jgi:hypothetical protein
LWRFGYGRNYNKQWRERIRQSNRDLGDNVFSFCKHVCQW